MSDTPAVKLLPCPFCGRDDSEDNACQTAAVTVPQVKAATGQRAYEVRCACGVTAARTLDYHQTIRQWNMRAQPAGRPLLDALKEEGRGQ